MCFHKVQLANSSSAIYPKVSKIYFELLFLCCFVLFYTLGIRNKNLVRDLSMNPVCLLLFLLTLTCAKFPGYIFFLVIIGGRSGYRLSFFFLKKRSELFSFFDFLSSSFPTSRKNQLGFFFFFVKHDFFLLANFSSDRSVIIYFTNQSVSFFFSKTNPAQH